MTTPDAMIYTVRPDRTTLWLPEWLASRMGIAKGARLSEAQMNHPNIQGLLEQRTKAQSGQNDFMTNEPRTKEVRLA